MLVRKFCWDRRVWSLSPNAFKLFVGMIPNTDIDGKLDADPDSLFAQCVPLSGMSAAEILAARAEMTATIPPLAAIEKDQFGREMAYLPDFEWANQGLDTIRKRLERLKDNIKDSTEEKRIEENRIEEKDTSLSTKSKISKMSGQFGQPTIKEVRAYCQERGKGIDPEAWYNHYSANGWKVGRNPMKDWKAAVRTWEARDKGGPNVGNGATRRIVGEAGKAAPNKYAHLK